MREILFRAKTLNTESKWVEGFYNHIPCGRFMCDEHLIQTINEGGRIGQLYTVHETTVGQFTGLYDSTKWEDLTDAEKLDFYHQHYIGKDGMSVRFQHIDDVKRLWKGKKIFEGDILHFWSEYQESYLGKCVVMYGKFNCTCCDGVFGWYLDGGDIRDLLDNSTIKYEICGNIHDNPELLEGAANG